MTTPRSLPIVLVCLFAASLSQAQEHPAPWTDWHYAAKIVCGVSKDPADMRLARGFYATTINVHNPSSETAVFTKRLALSYPPEKQVPGKLLEISEDKLPADHALKVDCIDLQRRLFPDGFPTPYIEGFVLLDSRYELDVTAVYTTAGLDRDGRPNPHSSIDVEQIAGRRRGAGGGGDRECPDLIVRDIGRPVVACPGGGGTCVTKVDVTIANVGTVGAGSFKVRTVLDPAAGVVVVRAFPGGLAAGGVATFTVVTPPGGNCFDPDCTISVLVDSGAEVDECDEKNNHLSEATKG